MKVIKENGKYYVNDLNLEEVLANRKHVVDYVNKEIEILEKFIESKGIKPETKVIYKTKLKVLMNVKKELQLRK